ncbi:MAG: HPt (histidine-containing phosphotransfer) domain-containing protein [Cryomorphaceae bacterium]|jgi:HPt (histidine-containing phosphotransfer) domain-containing protein
MSIQWNAVVINPDELMRISRGNNKLMLKYLHQFQELIPGRILSLKTSLEANDRIRIRQLLHQMSPQLHFFGIHDIEQPIRRLEHEYESIPYEDLERLVNKILDKLGLAIKDVDSILKKNSNS